MKMCPYYENVRVITVFYQMYTTKHPVTNYNLSAYLFRGFTRGYAFHALRYSCTTKLITFALHSAFCNGVNLLNDFPVKEPYSYNYKST